MNGPAMIQVDKQEVGDEVAIAGRQSIKGNGEAFNRRRSLQTRLRQAHDDLCQAIDDSRGVPCQAIDDRLRTGRRLQALMALAKSRQSPEYLHLGFQYGEQLDLNRDRMRAANQL